MALNKDRGLGRGLGALLGDAALQTQESGSVRLPISQVEPGLKQPRKYFDPDALADLAESIRTHGLIQPLTVRRLSSGYYQIIAGERRWRASKDAGLTEIPVVIIEADDRKVMELGLIENLQREDLNPIEEGSGYKILMEEHGLTQEEVAHQVGKSRSAVANAVRLLALSEGVRELLQTRQISAGHARAILSLESQDLQQELAQKVLDEDLSVRQTESVAKHINQHAEEFNTLVEEKPKHEDPNRIYREAAAKELSTRLGRRVSISHGPKKGKVELEYYDDNDLTNLLELLERFPSGGKEGVSL